ncbi:MAG: DNA polymerase, partial [Actinomycetota bacterium]|nr:DNA polymerase [Actinomycetota bacterium]
MPDSAKPTLMVIDGHSLAFRAFYALPVDSFTTRDGQHTNAIHGFLAMLLLLLQKEKPTHLAVAFDMSRFSFRNREYEEYKGNRDETPPEFKGQVPLLQEALKAMNIITIGKEDYEADDVLATLATQGAEEGFDVLLVSGDRDTIQLVDDKVTLLYPNARGVSELKRYDRNAVLERYGIEPHQYPDIAALVGESSDNLTGIDKVGEKTAVKWVLQYGGLDGILEHAEEIKGVVGQKLREQKDNAIRNRRLNQLVRDVELPVGPSDLERQPIDLAAVREVFDRLQFRTLLERITKIVAEESGEAAPQELAAPVKALKEPPVHRLVDEELARWIETASAGGTAPLGVRLDTAYGSISGFGLATETDSAYVPWAAGRQDYEAFEVWLASDAPKQLHASKRDFKLLAQAGLRMGGIAFDTSIASWLLRPGSKPGDLAAQVYDGLGETLPEADPNQLVPATEAVSPATEAWYVVRLAKALEERMSDSTRRVHGELELPLVPVLARMELDGITVNRGELARLNSELTDTAAELARRAFAEIGHEVNLGSPKQLQQVLFEELGMPKTRSTKTGFSTDAASLADLQDQLP